MAVTAQTVVIDTRDASLTNIRETEPFSFISLLVTLLRYTWLILGLALLLALWTIVTGLRQGRVYASESAFVLDTERPAAAVSGIAAQFGIAIPQSNDSQTPGFYADLLQSPTILRAVVDTAIPVITSRGTVPLRLADSIPASMGSPALRRLYAIQRLTTHINVNTAQRTGVVTLRVVDPDPQIALALNQRMLDLLNAFNLSRRRVRATEQRTFVEDRLDQARQALRDAEERLRAFSAANRVYAPSSEASVERQRLERDAANRAQLYQSLEQSYEQAKVEELRAAPLIAIIQAPELPVGPEPRRLARKAIIASIIGMVIGLFLAYALENLHRLRRDHPEQIQQLAAAVRRVFMPWRPAR